MASRRVEHSGPEEYELQAEPPVVVPGLIMTAHTLKVPLDYSKPDGATIDVFFRIVNDIQRAGKEKQPWLLYLQGGPGVEAPRPTDSSGWLSKAVQYFNVVLLDQRGTGKSSPITVSTIKRIGAAEAQADYIQHFRADNIVRDAEAIRHVLVGKDQRWSILGQSFGGFCCLNYLSTAPEALSEVFMTGGIPPLIDKPCAAGEAYQELYWRVIAQNRKYYSRFPQDVAIVQRLVLHLHNLPGGGVRLPRGSFLTPHALQTLGMTGLGSAGGFERLHLLLERTFDGPDLSQNFLMAEFDAVATARAGKPVCFTGEMVYPWMFEDFVELQPLKEVAHILANKADWPALYDEDVLKTNNVPIAAACYYEDMYVDFRLAEETASKVKSLRQWVTSEYMHSGLREDGPRILERLMCMTRNSRPIF